MRSLVFGVGINDADYNIVISKLVDGKTVKYWNCPFYERWKNMLCRCYNKAYQKRRSTYTGVSVCEEWLTFSNFKRWMEAQDWQGKHLDKDIIKIGNRVYSPDACSFVSNETNYFVIDGGKRSGSLPAGVSFKKDKGKFVANCFNLSSGKGSFIGYFTCPTEAHKAWKKRKHELACQLAELQTDDRVANALRSRYI